jgi:hypothetical protein
MPIDDNPIEALRKHFDLEDSSKSTVNRGIVYAASALLKLGKLPVPLEWLIQKVLEHIRDDGNEKIKIMLETVADVVIVHDNEIRDIRKGLSTDQAVKRSEVEAGLMIDASRRSAATRSIERVHRIGIILGNAISEIHTPDGDEIEEMMRVAAELNDVDISYLDELVRINGSIVEQDMRISRHTAYQVWESGQWGSSVNPEIDSVFHKLESYGLVTAIAPNNTLNVMADIQTRFALLPKGLRFWRLIAR